MVKRLGGWPYVVAGLGLAVAVVTAVCWALGRCEPGRAYWTVAIGTSVFYGLSFQSVWRHPEPMDGSFPLWPWRIHGWWLNGLCHFVGWSAGYVLRAQLGQKGEIGVTDFALGLVAMLGLCGWLPPTLLGFGMALGKISDKVTNTAASALGAK